jgi:hypothetical protein
MGPQSIPGTPFRWENGCMPELTPADLKETRRCLAALIEAIEAGELEATAYLLGYLRGALATLESLEF